MDLSRVPEPLRSKLQAQLERLPAEYRGPLEARLAKLPPEQLEAVLAKTTPMLERLMQKGGSSAGGASVAKAASSRSGSGRASGSGMSGIAPSQTRINNPHDHYNATVGRGDRPMPSLIVLVFVVALAFVLLRGMGWLG